MPKRDTEYTFEVGLESIANPGKFQTNVTLVAGDVKVSQDGGSLANIASLPTEIGTSGLLTVVLSALEMTAYRVGVLFHDVAGAEWEDLLVTIETGIHSLDDIPSEVWDSAVRTLTVVAAGTRAVIKKSLITIHRGDTINIPIIGLGDLTNYQDIDFTVKETDRARDNDAIIRIRKNVGASSDGLIRLNKEAAGTSTDGSIVIDDVSLGNITITIKPAATVTLVPVNDLYYDIQMITLTTVDTMSVGQCDIIADVTRAIT